MMSSLLEQLRQSDSERQAVATREYLGLVVAVASDKAGDATKASGILRESGRSVDDLEREAALLRQRRQWAKQIEAGAEARERQAKREERLAEINAELEEFRQKRMIEAAGLKTGEEAMRDNRAVNEIRMAERQLRETSAEAATEREAALAEKSKRANGRLQTTRDKIDRCKGMPHSDERTARLAEHDAMVTQLLTEIRQISEEQTALHEERLVPEFCWQVPSDTVADSESAAGDDAAA